MPVPEQLAQIPILRARHPHPRKAIFHHQLQDVIGIAPVGLLPTHTSCSDLRRVAHPQLVLQLRQQPLEPAGMPGRFHPQSHVDSPELQFAIKLLRFSIAVLHLLLAAFSRFRVNPSDLLKARMIIASYNQHARLLSPEPWSFGTTKSTQVEGADAFMKSVGISLLCLWQYTCVGLLFVGR